MKIRTAFFEKINKMDKLLATLTKKDRGLKYNRETKMIDSSLTSK